MNVGQAQRPRSTTHPDKPSSGVSLESLYSFGPSWPLVPGVHVSGPLPSTMTTCVLPEPLLPSRSLPFSTLSQLPLSRSVPRALFDPNSLAFLHQYPDSRFPAMSVCKHVSSLIRVWSLTSDCQGPVGTGSSPSLSLLLSCGNSKHAPTVFSVNH